MSLDVYLTLPGTKPCPHCGGAVRLAAAEVFEANITHNLSRMADACGVYGACWRPEEHGLTKAGQLAPVLRDGLARLKADPDKYRVFDASNGWGTYERLVPWLERYLAACEAYPEADVRVRR